MNSCNIQLRSNIDCEKNESLKMSLENVRKGKRGLLRFLRDLIFRKKKLQRLKRKKRERNYHPLKFINEEEIRISSLMNEYAKVVEILDSEKLNLTYYMDTPGNYL